MKRVFIIALLVTSCTVAPPKLYEVGEMSESHRIHKVLGIPYKTVIERIESPKQTKDRLRREKAEKEQDMRLKQEERQNSAAFWGGVTAFGLAVACVIAGYLLQGWKFWGGLAAILAGIGSLSWAFAHWVPYLKWLIIPVAGAGIAKTMHGAKDFSAKNWLSRFSSS